MATLKLKCPLCCGEVFNDYNSLKYHLLSMTDNLYCPGCSKRIYSMAALIQHLDICRNTVSTENKENSSPLSHFVDLNKIGNVLDPNIFLEENDEAIEDIFSSDTNNKKQIVIISHGRTLQVDEDGQIQLVESPEKSNPLHMENEIVIPCDREDYEMFNLKNEKALVNVPQINDTGDNSTTISINENIEIDQLSNHSGIGDNGQKDDIYNCSTCQINFLSITDHVREYHDGQEVVLEIENHQLSDNTVLSENGFKNNNNDPKPGKKFRSSEPKLRYPLNTIKTEECIDINGQVYTRKVVQIDKSWNQVSATTKAKTPMVENIFSNIEGVKVIDESIMVTPAKMYRCNQCREQFSKLDDFQIHSCLQEINKCDYCDQKFSSEDKLLSHLKVHDNSILSQKIFLCTVCGTEFLTHKSLRLHSRMHAPVRTRHVDAPEGSDNLLMFTCNECGKTLSESYKEAHMALHAGETITCTICNRKFDSAESLKMHVAVHSDITQKSPSKELAQSEFFNENTALDNELKSFSIDTYNNVTSQSACTNSDTQSLKPYQCQHCGRRFTRPHEKVKHERIHTGEKPHACEVCGKTFRVSYCLTLHMRTHTGVRPYECQHCGKRFKASSVYNHHLLTHGEERAYNCPYCPKTFKTRVQLAGHKNSHTKPFHCTKCTRAFASLYAARAHIQTHKGDNNLKFCCEVCGASYGRAFALKDHMKQHEQHESNSINLSESAREETEEEEVAIAANYILANENNTVEFSPLNESFIVKSE